MKHKLSILGGIAVVGLVGSIALGTLAFAQAQPVSVSCSAGLSANVITWSAAASGGTAPYNFNWSGNAGVNGATTTPIVASYNANGTYTAIIQVTDSATSTATATCAATVTSIVVPTSTVPFTVNPNLTIGGNGKFNGVGMKVTSVSSGTFQASIWGIAYTINWSGNLQDFYFRYNKATSTTPAGQLTVGDVVGVSGKVASSTPFVIAANVVRDYSITGPKIVKHDDGNKGKDQGVDINVKVNGNNGNGMGNFFKKIGDFFHSHFGGGK